MAYIVRNVAPGPRGIHTPTGIKMLDPGETRTLDLSDAERDGAIGTGHFEIDASEDVSERDALKALADERGIKYAKNISTAKLREMLNDDGA